MTEQGFEPVPLEAVRVVATKQNAPHYRGETQRLAKEVLENREGKRTGEGNVVAWLQIELDSEGKAVDWRYPHIGSAMPGDTPPVGYRWLPVCAL